MHGFQNLESVAQCGALQLEFVKRTSLATDFSRNQSHAYRSRTRGCIELPELSHSEEAYEASENKRPRQDAFREYRELRIFDLSKYSGVF